ncbi:MAG: hypothetical protein JGK30_31510 [Microcoleus sp. PH2017_40_RAT_O_B]|nr:MULTISPECIES: hypothetical protein [unclassified Microcoleus]MCC3576074.1 hypothetical protein [Microcoleus sp. PH2017_34_RAT_O_A]MCC3457814.1 hypothetical protein [Microcoleus sp. PH2017_08_TRC_O_A]MCC3476236.1 hypothetical protein [Microcoleus sp. PH2017_13_LAR_U_A]MCC3488706.1 hypothetical protein [Microcoleus sp. PH2017_14_LAR_D_A]MCC3500956.1 hypothetical protein [Microcoleus sp. PH2017_15_JOR_U_A]
MGWAEEPATGKMPVPLSFVGWAEEPATGILPVPQKLWSGLLARPKDVFP